ncbi:hypothetical protein J7394_09680 [Ruegeria sp. R13_0]|uniref:imm11 family protein n=1 Tax=Ruegeria sp. R13_0 TaxID=2821099 RepID=UPI001ADCDCCC|nr:hypothetical protein [Ruegeria sp. R13_0]MBO9434475.1 hypothetical protein [Ruegeria sp. R13_0]
MTMSDRNSDETASAINESAAQPSASHVWYLDARRNMSIGFGFRDEIWERNRKERIDLSARLNRGDLVECNELPPRMWIDKGFQRDSNRKLPHLFSAGSVLACSQSLVDALKPFDLGKSVFWPMSFLKHDRETPFEGGPFYLFQIREIKRAFSTKDSVNYIPREFDHQTFLGLVSLTQKDDEIRLLASASEVDVWIDPSLGKSIFVSDAVYRTLRKTNLLGKIAALRCPILPESN